MEFRSGRSNLKGRNKWTLEYTMTFFHFLVSDGCNDWASGLTSEQHLPA